MAIPKWDLVEGSETVEEWEQPQGTPSRLTPRAAVIHVPEGVRSEAMPKRWTVRVWRVHAWYRGLLAVRHFDRVAEARLWLRDEGYVPM